ncbi:MAG: DUF4145 domain-containing protein [Balneolaceae bacterium]
MAELVADCPRCGANRITFNLLSSITVKVNGWKHWYEVFSICRQCHHSTVFILIDVHNYYQYVHDTGLLNIEAAVNRYVENHGFVSLKDVINVEPPDHVPEQIEMVFREGATCLSVNCWNAAGTMFRLCIDLVTKGLMPEEDTEGLNARIRKSLGLRLQWLFENGKLPEGIKELSTCVQQDGNDGAHDGSLEKEDAENLLDFTMILLERIYTEPERVRLASERREQRRNQSN